MHCSICYCCWAGLQAGMWWPPPINLRTKSFTGRTYNSTSTRIKRVHCAFLQTTDMIRGAIITLQHCCCCAWMESCTAVCVQQLQAITFESKYSLKYLVIISCWVTSLCTCAIMIPWLWRRGRTVFTGLHWGVVLVGMAGPCIKRFWNVPGLAVFLTDNKHMLCSSDNSFAFCSWISAYFVDQKVPQHRQGAAAAAVSAGRGGRKSHRTHLGALV